MAIIRNYFTGNKSLEFSEEQIANTLAIGTNWSFIRVGVLCQISASPSTSSISSINFAMGLTSGTSSLYGSAAGPTHFVGLRTAITTSIFINTFANTFNPYFYVNDNDGVTTKVGYQVGTGSFREAAGVGVTSGITFGGLITASTNLPGGQIYSLPIYIDFIKPTNPSSPWNIRTAMYGLDATGFELLSTGSITSFYNNLAAITASNDLVGNRWRNNSFDVPVSESLYGFLDSINIHWNKTAPFNVYEIAVYRFN